MSRLLSWLDARSPLGQWVASCLGIITIVTVCLYTLGLGSYLIRPSLAAPTQPPATVVITLPTVPLETPVTPTLFPTLDLPGSTLEATPTQAPVPTRLPTSTPTPVLEQTVETPDMLMLPATPEETATVPATATPEPTLPLYTAEPTRTRRSTRTPTDTPRPQRTRRATRSPQSDG